MAVTKTGGSGDDTLAGTGNADTLRGESGDDTFYAVDGYRDYTDCDSGTDRVQRDNFDRVLDCEQRF